MIGFEVIAPKPVPLDMQAEAPAHLEPRDRPRVELGRRGRPPAREAPVRRSPGLARCSARRSPRQPRRAGTRPRAAAARPSEECRRLRSTCETISRRRWKRRGETSPGAQHAVQLSDRSYRAQARLETAVSVVLANRVALVAVFIAPDRRAWRRAGRAAVGRRGPVESVVVPYRSSSAAGAAVQASPQRRRR